MVERRNRPSTVETKATTQSLGTLLKSARDIMRKDKGLNGDLDPQLVIGCKSVVSPFQGDKCFWGICSWAFRPGFNLTGFQPANPKGPKVRNVIAWAGASPTSAGPSQPPPKIS